MNREIHVYGDWQTLCTPTRIGLLRSNVVRGAETFSFEYDPCWLENHHTLILDPELQLYRGPKYLGDKKKSNFGIFLDSSPDRWGRLIMQRREAMIARREKRHPQLLFESDYLLGVHDQQRMGGLRFAEKLEGPFLSNHDGLQAPPWTSLRELEHAAWQIQATDETDRKELNEWINLLFAPGSSIGGARPKAGVRDEYENLWIAKFPGREDEFDVGAWEFVVYKLALGAGLSIAEARGEEFGRPHHTFLTKRFDRVVENHERKRVHFASAMTVLGYSDGTSHRDGASYLDLIELLIQQGADVERDLHELWRRIVFSICVSNTDDHLRNHGFLLTEQGWKLSPAFDINPNPHGTGLHLNISESDNSLDLELARDVSEYFRLSRPQSDSIIEEVVRSVNRWRDEAERIGIPHGEQERMQNAFGAK